MKLNKSGKVGLAITALTVIDGGILSILSWGKSRYYQGRIDSNIETKAMIEQARDEVYEKYHFENNKEEI